MFALQLLVCFWPPYQVMCHYGHYSSTIFYRPCAVSMLPMVSNLSAPGRVCPLSLSDALPVRTRLSTTQRAPTCIDSHVRTWATSLVYLRAHAEVASVADLLRSRTVGILAQRRQTHLPHICAPAKVAPRDNGDYGIGDFRQAIIGTSFGGTGKSISPSGPRGPRCPSGTRYYVNSIWDMDCDHHFLAPGLIFLLQGRTSCNLQLPVAMIGVVKSIPYHTACTIPWSV